MQSKQTYAIESQFPVSPEGGLPTEEDALDYLKEWTAIVRDAYADQGDLDYKKKHTMDLTDFLDSDNALYSSTDEAIRKKSMAYMKEASFPGPIFSRNRTGITDYVKEVVVMTMTLNVTKTSN